MTLTDFLLARIAEDEAVAREAQATGNGWWTDGDGEVWAHMQLVCHPTMTSHAAHIALNHPAKVLAECEAKRNIVRAWSRLYTSPPLGDRLAGQARETAGHVFRELARVYADHPDYRDEWKP